ncbi:hypothetical protein [Opitutus terrae]|uniref:hypothetical protein n=1 Tax=Opitutus terrae TaxID=107709 RepID=UPI0011D044BA|nr:hypothetical protein [Opitutus terrae]
MNSRFAVSATLTATEKRRLRLAHQLRSAQQGLQQWEASIRAGLAALPNDAQPSSSADVETMLATLVEARIAIEHRLREIDRDQLSTEPLSPMPMRAAPGRWRMGRVQWLQRLCVKACQACGRSLATAFRRARAAADLSTATVLYGAMRAFEKQIWLLDPHHARLR